MRLFYLIVVTAILSATTVFAGQQQDQWASYVDGSVGRNFYYLYQQIMSVYFKDHNQHRALNLGTGAGDVDVDLAAHDWNVTSVDASTRSGEVIAQRMKFVKGQYQFQKADFSKAELAGNYDLVTAFFALPFGNKSELPMLMANISKHTRKGAVVAVNFFGNDHTFVKAGQCYGMTKDEVTQLLSLNGFEIQFYLNRRYKQEDFNGNNTFWDLLDVIAVKS